VKEGITPVNPAGGKEEIEARNRAVLMTAHERLHSLFDSNFSGEVFRFMRHFSASFAIVTGSDVAAAAGVASAAGNTFAIRG
jgi:hypothetical protein